jgi:hypothetical protein
VLVLNGLFPKGALRSLGATLGAGWTIERDALSRAGASPFIGQAPDGAVVVAPTLARLSAALEGSDRGVALGLDQQAQAMAALRGAAVGSLLAALPFTGPAGAIGRATAALRPVDPMEIVLTFYPVPPAGVAAVRRQVDDLLSRARTAAREAPGRDLGGERAVLERAQITEEADYVVISSKWARNEVDRAAASAAAALRARRALSRSATPPMDQGASPPDQ